MELKSTTSSKDSNNGNSENGLAIVIAIMSVIALLIMALR
jgi:hypothetical protein